jgi:protein gp37
MDWHDGKPPSNIIQLTSIENQAMLEKRYRDSVAIPAACRGFSFEPLLSEIIVPDWTGISWAIIGGESGSNARPCNVDWIRSLVEQGKAAGAATFVKQFGANPVSVYKPSDEKDYCTITMNHRDKKGGDIAEFPKDLQVREWPKGF